MTRALVSARSFPWPLSALDAVPIETPACAATSLMVARLLSGSLTGKRLLQLSVQGQRLHIVIEPSLYRLDDGIEHVLGCQGKPIPDLEARCSLVAPRYQRTDEVGNVGKQAGCRLSPGKRGGRYRCFSRSGRPGAAPITALGASFPSREGNAVSGPRLARLTGRGPPDWGQLDGVIRRNRWMRVRRPGPPDAVRRPGAPDAGPPTPELLGLSLLGAVPAGAAPVALPRRRPTGPGTAGPALAPGFLFFGLFLPVSAFITPIF